MGKPQGFTGCDRCFKMAWDEPHQPAADRNGMRHHPYCLVIARDGLADNILAAAVRLAYAEGIGEHRRALGQLKQRVREYEDWRIQRGLGRSSFDPYTEDDYGRRYYLSRGGR